MPGTKPRCCRVRETKAWLKNHAALKSGVKGIIIDADTKRPLANIRLSIFPNNSIIQAFPDFPSDYEVITGKDGSFAFVLPEGQYAIGSHGRLGGKEQMAMLVTSEGALINFRVGGNQMLDAGKVPLSFK